MTAGCPFIPCFARYDVGKDTFIDFEELKHMMEKLGTPQTHLALKEMIRQVDEDQDNKISFREVGLGLLNISTLQNGI